MTPKQSATLADLHLVTHTWANKPQLRGDSILAMEYFFDYCLETSSSAKLLGDMFHTLTPNPEYVKPLFDKLTQMQEAGLPVYYIQGNHDLNLVPWMSLHPWPINLNKVVVELPECGMTALGQQSTHSDELRSVLSSIPDGVDTLLLHQAEPKAMPFSFEFLLDDVPKTIKNILIGHIHTPQDYTNGSTHLWYPGSPHVTSIDQVEQKGFLIEKVVGGETEISRGSIPGRSFYRVRVDGLDDDALDLAEAKIKELSEADARWQGLKPVVRVEYPAQLAAKAHQRFLAIREPLGVYTWLDVEEECCADTKHAEGRSFTGDINMPDIINDYVDQAVPKELLLKIYGGNDTGDVLRSGLEGIV